MNKPVIDRVDEFLRDLAPHIRERKGAELMMELRGNYAEIVGELDQISALMVTMIDQMGEPNRGPDAPGHWHADPGVWDSYSGKLAGQPCAMCAIWRRAEAMSQNWRSNRPMGKKNRQSG